MKRFTIYHGDGSQETVEAAKITFEKKPDGLKIKIGKRIIRGAVALVEYCPPIVIPQHKSDIQAHD